MTTKEFIERIAELEKDNQRKDRTIQNLNMELDNLQAEADSLLLSKNTRIEKLSEANELVQSQLTAVRRYSNEMEEEVARLNDKLEWLEIEYNHLHKDRQSMQTIIDALNLQLGALQKTPSVRGRW